MDIQKLAENNLIMSGVARSHAYGTNIESSDIDIRGVFIAPVKTMLSPFTEIEQVTYAKSDTVYYELTKFIKLLVDQNPNILELLWLDESSITLTTPAYLALRGMRWDLLSSKVKHTFSGYAHSQLKRIKGHSKWLNKPQPEKSTTTKRLFIFT